MESLYLIYLLSNCDDLVTELLLQIISDSTIFKYDKVSGTIVLYCNISVVLLLYQPLYGGILLIVLL